MIGSGYAGLRVVRAVRGKRKKAEAARYVVGIGKGIVIVPQVES